MPHQNLPRLERTGGHVRLIVEEKPFLCIGGVNCIIRVRPTGATCRPSGTSWQRQGSTR